MRDPISKQKKKKKEGRNWFQELLSYLCLAVRTQENLASPRPLVTSSFDLSSNYKRNFYIQECQVFSPTEWGRANIGPRMPCVEGWNPACLFHMVSGPEPSL